MFNRYLRIYINSIRFIRQDVALESKIRTKAHIVDKAIHSIPFEIGRGLSNVKYLEYLLSIQETKNSDKVTIWANNILNIYHKKQNNPDMNVYRPTQYEKYPEVLELIKTRVSVRNFKFDKPEICDLNKAVEVALSAPSSCHRQPVKFYHIIKDDHICIATGCISGSTGFTNNNIPIISVVSADTRSYSLRDGETYVVDTALAVENFVLGLRMLGIGSTIMNWSHADNSQISELKGLCKVPDYEEIITTVAIGYPEKLPLKPSSVDSDSRSVVVE